jgi:hypothetical protein
MLMLEAFRWEKVFEMGWGYLLATKDTKFTKIEKMSPDSFRNFVFLVLFVVYLFCNFAVAI